MKNLLILIMLVLSLSGFATILDGVVDQVELAIKMANSKKVTELLDASVDITIVDEEGTYSKTQANEIIKSFFQKNQVKDFKIIHKGDANGDSQYSIGKLTNEKGESYRVYVYLVKRGELYKIQELRFEEE